MKITKRQLRRIIKEERTKLLLEASSGFSSRAMREMDQAISYFRDRGSEEDAVDLEGIRDMAVKEKAAGAEFPSKELFDWVNYNLDTVVYEEMPQDFIDWTTSFDEYAD